ncbi:MAG: phosphodiester glycosidase family protein [Myxococcales bacterium]
MTRVNAQITNLRSLRQQLTAAVADSKISREEFKALQAATKKVDAAGNRMLERQGAPSIAVAAQVQRAMKKGTLPQDAAALAASIRQSILDMRRIEQQMAARDPLKKLPGRWHPAFQGVKTRTIVRDGMRVHLVAVDLLKAHLQTNTRGERGRTVSGQAKAHGAEIAINGDFFSFANYQPSGHAKADGKPWPSTADSWEPFVAFGGQRVQVLAGGKDVPAWADNAVSGRPMVLDAGKVVTEYREPTHAGVMPRTGVGLSQNGRLMLLAVVDGRSTSSRGASAQELGRILKQNGAHTGIALDGGGSSTMYVKSRGVVNRPSDGAERKVSNALMVQARGGRR